MQPYHNVEERMMVLTSWRDKWMHLVGGLLSTSWEIPEESLRSLLFCIGKLETIDITPDQKVGSHMFLKRHPKGKEGAGQLPLLYQTKKMSLTYLSMIIIKTMRRPQSGPVKASPSFEELLLQTLPLLCQLCMWVELRRLLSLPPHMPAVRVELAFFSVQTLPGCLPMEYTRGPASGRQVWEPHMWFLITPVLSARSQWLGLSKTVLLAVWLLMLLKGITWFSLCFIVYCNFSGKFSLIWFPRERCVKPGSVGIVVLVWLPEPSVSLVCVSPPPSFQASFEMDCCSACCKLFWWPPWFLRGRLRAVHA